MMHSFPRLPHKYIFKNHVPLAWFCCFQATHSSTLPWHITPLYKSSKARNCQSKQQRSISGSPKGEPAPDCLLSEVLSDPSEEKFCHQIQERVKFWWLLSPGLNSRGQQCANQQYPPPAGDEEVKDASEGLDTFLPRSQPWLGKGDNVTSSAEKSTDMNHRRETRWL